MTFRRAALLIAIAALAAMLAACGSSSSTPPAISIAFTPQYPVPASLSITAPGNATPLAATITNGPQNALVNWTVTCNSAQCGSFDQPSTASAVPTTYTAPTTVPSGGSVTIKAASADDSTKSVTASITITSSIGLSYTSGSTPPTSLNSTAPGNTAALAVTIANGPPNATVNWSVTCGSAQCGSFSLPSTTSTQQTTYTAPATAPSPATVTITATSANDSSKSTTPATINITQSPVTIAFTSGSTPPGSMLISGAATIGATVTNDLSNSGVNWTVTCSSAQCGGFSPAHTVSGATTQFTAPAAVPAASPNPGTVTVTAASAANPSVFVQATITITSNITVAFTSAPPASVLIDSQTNLAATVTSDPGSGGVTWSCTPASLCGTFAPATTASGQTTVYTAPAAVPAGNTVTITATAVDDYTKSTTPPATITITSNITVAFTSAPASPMSTNTQQEIAAYTTGEPTNAGVTWSVTCGSAPCGTFGQSPTLNNVPTLYTAPLTVPTGTTVTVTATTVSDFNKSKSANITITQPPTTLPCPGPAGSECNYVFQLSGEDNNQQSPFYVAGAFTIQSGAIIGGEQDFVDLTFEGSDEIHRDSNTTITPTPDGNLQIVLDTGDSSIGPIVDGVGNGLETLNVALVTSSSGLVTWFDGFASGNGTIALQNATAAQALPQNGYAFVASGTDNNVDNPAPVVMGGIINVDDLSGPGTISGSGSVFDFSDASATAPEPDQPLAATSNVAGPTGGSTPDKYGKVVFTLSPNASPAIPTIAFASYIIDANTIALVETADDYSGTSGGIALAQAKTGQFGTSDLSGSSYVVGAQGADEFFFLNFVGSLSFGSGGSVTGTADFNDQENADSLASVIGTYSVDSTGISAKTGRVTITNFTGATGTEFDLNFDPTSATPQPATLQLYLDGNGNALLASMDLYDWTAGPAFKQTLGASLSGSYALSGVGVSITTLNTWSAVGPIIIGSNGTIGAGSFTDFNYFAETLPATECVTAASTCAHLALTGTASNPNGPITGLDADSILAPPIVPDTFDFYVIDGLRAFGIETDLNTQTGLLYLQAPPVPKAHAKTHK